jgi:hypothetical protein
VRRQVALQGPAPARAALRLPARRRRRGAGAAAAAPSASSDRITDPSLTVSPMPTFIALTTPACDDGISIDALSLSTVISDCSTLTASPALTSTSITETPLKSPMSGTLMSINGMAGLSQEDPAEVRQDLPEVCVEAGRAAPSITRWSQLRLSGSIRRGWNALPSQRGSVALLQTPRIATSGALMIGVK